MNYTCTSAEYITTVSMDGFDCDVRLDIRGVEQVEDVCCESRKRNPHADRSRGVGACDVKRQSSRCVVARVYA